MAWAARWRPRGWRHWTLRSRLVFAVAVLSAIGLIVVNGLGVLLLRSYLNGKVDEQLTSVSRPLVDMMSRDGVICSTQQRGLPRAGPAQYVYAYDGAGEPLKTVASEEELSPPRLPSYDQLERRVGAQPYTVSAVNSSDRWRVLVLDREAPARWRPRDVQDAAACDTTSVAPGGIVVVAVSLRQTDAIVTELVGIDVAVTVLLLLLLGLAAAAVVRFGLHPLTRMEAISAEITAGDLSRRVDDADPHTEPGRLGIALNTMLNRIESEVAARIASEQRLRQFVADASHELRTPLTSIRGFAELYRRGGAPPGPALDETMSRIESEAARMGLLVEDLLLLARLDMRRPLERRPVDLLGIAADTIRDAHARAPNRMIHLAALDERSPTFEPVTVLGDEHRLRQVATNLVANAMQHTPDNANIAVRVGRLDPARRSRRGSRVVAAVGNQLPPLCSAAVLEIADDGPGVPREHAPRVFERLYRVDRSRTRVSGGSGLGLSIVAAIVHSHGGRVELETDEGGATFRVLLPTTLPST